MIEKFQYEINRRALARPGPGNYNYIIRPETNMEDKLVPFLPKWYRFKWTICSVSSLN